MMFPRLKPSMPSCRRIERNPSFRKLEHDKKERKIAENQRFFDPFSWRLSATFGPATIATMTQKSQRLSEICQRLSSDYGKSPKKSWNFRKNRRKIEIFWQKMGQIPEKWEKLPFFGKNRGGFCSSLHGPLWGVYKGRFPFGGIGVQDGEKPRKQPPGAAQQERKAPLQGRERHKKPGVLSPGFVRCKWQNIQIAEIRTAYSPTAVI